MSYRIILSLNLLVWFEMVVQCARFIGSIQFFTCLTCQLEIFCILEYQSRWVIDLSLRFIRFLTTFWAKSGWNCGWVNLWRSFRFIHLVHEVVILSAWWSVSFGKFVQIWQANPRINLGCICQSILHQALKLLSLLHSLSHFCNQHSLFRIESGGLFLAAHICCIPILCVHLEGHTASSPFNSRLDFFNLGFNNSRTCSLHFSVFFQKANC